MASTQSQREAEVPLDSIQRIAEFREQLRAFTSRSDDVARRWDLTPQRYLLLLMVVGAPGGDEQLRLAEIAERLHLSSNAATELVTRAEELGLVRRAQAAHDHRVVFVSATAEGKRRLVGAIEENERARSDLKTAFARLARSFRNTA